jgi:hypothetical protein
MVKISLDKFSGVLYHPHMVDIKVLETEDHRWALVVNGVEIGSSKNRFDADFSVVQLRKALSDFSDLRGALEGQES